MFFFAGPTISYPSNEENVLPNHLESILKHLDRNTTNQDSILKHLQLNTTKQDTLLKNQDYTTSLLKVLVKENQTLRDDMNRLRKSFRLNALTVDGQEAASKLPVLPVRNIDDLNELEKLISLDTEQNNILVSKLAHLGGAKCSTVIHTMMHWLITKEVAVQFSLRGKFAKRSFAALHIYACIMRKIPHFSV